MADQMNRVRVDELDWAQVLPWANLFRSFRLAIDPPKLLLALFLVVLLYLSGRVLDVIWGPQVYQGEPDRYATQSLDEFQHWQSDQAEEIRTALRRHLMPLRLDAAKADSIVAAPDPFAAAVAAINEHHHAQVSRVPEEQRNGWERTRLERIEQVHKLRRGREGIFHTALRYELAGFDRMIDAATRLDFGFAAVISGSEYRSNSEPRV